MDDATQNRVAAFGDELIRIHDHLRETLDELRDRLGAGPMRPENRRSLQEHCIGFCATLTAHHTSEDRVAFPLLAAQHPELAPVLAELEHDHQLVAGVLRSVDDLVGRLADGDDPDRVRSGLDGLTAILESHFTWEERRIATALNGLVAPGTSTRDLFGVSPAELD